MRILPDHEKLQYSGRIDWTDRKAPGICISMYFCENAFYGRDAQDLCEEIKKHIGKIISGVFWTGSRQKASASGMMGKGFWRYRSVL